MMFFLGFLAGALAMFGVDFVIYVVRKRRHKRQAAEIERRIDEFRASMALLAKATRVAHQREQGGMN